MKFVILIIFFLFQVCAEAQEKIIPITPQPLNVVYNDDIFIIKETTKIITDNNQDNSTSFLINYISKYYGLNLKVQSSSKNDNDINTINLHIVKSGSQDGSYKLTINNNKIKISSASAEGIFNGVQSLIQLIPISNEQNIKGQLILPGIEINDAPRFLYRGVHLDVSRHFFSVEYLKRFLDYLAYNKINKFHWHLTDDQGWRIEIKQYPLLTEVGGCRDQTLIGRFGSGIYDSSQYCKYYTQEQIKEVIKYASERFITIIPEIDMPGHTTAALASYPYLGCTKGPYKVSQTWGVHKEVLCAGNDSTYNFIENVLDEVIQLFPSNIIHIGGDECLKERWKECNVCQNRIKTEGLKNETELQSYFIKRVSKYLKRKGKTIIGWDEILDGGASKDAIIMNWRGEKIGIEAARLGHQVIMTPEKPLYLNHQQSRNEDSLTQGGLNTLESVYNYNPVPEELDASQKKLIIGTQANFWTEYINNVPKLEYMAFPRLSAFAEVALSKIENKNWQHFESKLPGLLDRYKFLGIKYSDAYFDLQPEVIIKDNKIFWQLTSKRKGEINYYSPGSDSVNIYNSPMEINKNGIWRAFLTDSTNQKGNILTGEFNLNKATGKKITLVNQPNSMYFQQGANTLVDGLHNNEGMVKAGKFLGFLGKDLEAIIDLGSEVEINQIILRI
ncbi:MAG: beta-N-acetylhexosaminidase, partial [Ferruginibacter sp.]